MLRIGSLIAQVRAENAARSPAASQSLIINKPPTRMITTAGHIGQKHERPETTQPGELGVDIRCTVSVVLFGKLIHFVLSL